MQLYNDRIAGLANNNNAIPSQRVASGRLPIGDSDYLLIRIGGQILSSDFWFCPDGETKASTVAERRGVAVVRVSGPPTI